MANTKISQLTELTTPTGDEELVYAYNNTNGKIKMNTIKSFSGVGKQDTLINQVNIKSINNTSLLGGGNINISGGGGGQEIYDAIVATSGGDYTTLGAAITAGKRNIYIKPGTYNESPITLTDDNISITGAGAESVVLNYSVTGGALNNGGACITFSTTNEEAATTFINHSISGITFDISLSGTGVTYGYFINAYGIQGSPSYTANIYDCVFKVSESGDTSYLDITIGGATDPTKSASFIGCRIDVTSSTGSTTYRGSRTRNISNKVIYVGCHINVHTESSYSVSLLSEDFSKYSGSNIQLNTTGAGNASLIMGWADNCTIQVDGATSNSVSMNLHNSVGCKISAINAVDDISGLNKDTVVGVWKSSTSYSVGDFVTYNSYIFKCNTAHTSGDTFSYSYWDDFRCGMILDSVTGSDISGGGLVLVSGGTSSNKITCSKVLAIGDDTKSTSNGTNMIGNKIQVPNWIKVIGYACVLSGNVVSSNDGIYYNDLYDIIKDNIIYAYNSVGNPTVTVVGTNNNYSKVSDNITLGSL